jgi:hypothetical protein
MRVWMSIIPFTWLGIRGDSSSRRDGRVTINWPGLAGMLDHDPLLLLELRGIERDRLRQALAETPWVRPWSA